MTKDEKLQEGIRKLEELKLRVEEFADGLRGLTGAQRKLLIRLRKKVLRKELSKIMRQTK